MTDRLIPPDLPPLQTDDQFSADDATVLDFWRWALGDLRMNNARGYLAEFLVARAVKAKHPHRVEWAAHDVATPAGVRIEVKSSAYLQSWAQPKPSTPRFGLTGAAGSWDAETGEWFVDPRGRVDVWVFCLQTSRSHLDYHPLDIGQWRFWVAANAEVEELAQKSAGLATIERLAGGESLEWADLDGAVSSTAAHAGRSPVRLRPQAERDAAMTELVETTD